MKLILASASPRRRELFEKLGLSFTVVPSSKEPPTEIYANASDFAMLSAKTKAEDIFFKNPDSIVVGADTVVSCDGKLLGKPKNEQNAYEMLRSLSGRRHEVLTAVYICSKEKNCGFVAKTEVEFYELSDKEIWDYVNSGDGSDKAGSYGIQTSSLRFVKGICGDYNNVVGFPAAEFIRFLEKENIKI